MRLFTHIQAVICLQTHLNHYYVIMIAITLFCIKHGLVDLYLIPRLFQLLLQVSPYGFICFIFICVCTGSEKSALFTTSVYVYHTFLKSLLFLFPPKASPLPSQFNFLVFSATKGAGYHDLFVFSLCLPLRLIIQILIYIIIITNKHLQDRSCSPVTEL